MAKIIEYKQAEDSRDAFSHHGVRYLFLRKSGAIWREKHPTERG